jgi:hypothetical protein
MRALWLVSLLAVSLPAGASLENDGAWKGGVWASTAWADGAWREEADPGIPVPDVIGMTQEDADTAFEAVGLDTGNVATVCSAATEGDVVSQAPPAGASVPPGSTVDIALSSGEPCKGAGGKLKLRLDLRL